MNRTVIPIASATPAEDASRQRKRQAPKGRQVLVSALADVQALIGTGPYRRDLLIEYLHALQDRFGQLATTHLAALAQVLKLPQTEVFEVASFYHHFDIVREDASGAIPAPPRLTVRVCDGLPCEMAGARDLLAKLPDLLGAQLRVIAVPCIGRCEQAPAVAVHQHPVALADIENVLQAVQAGHTAAAPAPTIDLASYRAQGGYTLLRDCVEHRRDVEAVLKTMEDSGLRGLGGAGFPAGRKWRIVRSEPAPRLMAVNIDEGEPGTFKDRVLLEADPHRFIEGMLIAAWAVGIEAIYIYLRDEYHGARALLTAELAKLRAAPPLADMPRIELRRGAGAYICGEESAMIESIEGKRGLPRLRPPYVAQVGLFGRPTLEHNFETLYWVRELLEHGAQHGSRAKAGMAARACAASRCRAGCATPASSWRRPASRCANWSTSIAAACFKATRCMPTCPAVRRAASCRRGWPMCRWTSTRCSPMAASSAPPR